MQYFNFTEIYRNAMIQRTADFQAGIQLGLRLTSDAD